MLFSQRYNRAIESGTITVNVPEPIRAKLWTRLKTCNSAVYVRPDPNDNWTHNSSVIEETGSDLAVEMGWEKLPVPATQSDLDPVAGFRSFLMSCAGHHVFDVLERAYHYMEENDKATFKAKTNEIFELAQFPWRFSAGKLFKLDAEFVGAALASEGLDALASYSFDGAADEYSKSRQYLASGDVREAIYNAGHSFESVMKVMTGLELASGDLLIKSLGEQGYFDDLPEAVRAGFRDQVLKALPFMRNKLGGHGQGATVVRIPHAYGELVVQMAAAFHNFLIAKHLERNPVTPAPEPTLSQTSSSYDLDEEIPF